LPGDVVAKMTSNDPGVGIETAANTGRDHDLDRLAFVEIRLGPSEWGCKRLDCKQDDNGQCNPEGAHVTSSNPSQYPANFLLAHRGRIEHTGEPVKLRRRHTHASLLGRARALIAPRHEPIRHNLRMAKAVRVVHASVDSLGWR